MKDEQIIKALEYCCGSIQNDCRDCPFGERCENDESLLKYSLDLINRKDAEIINRTEEYNDMLEQRNKVEEALEVMAMDVNSLTSERDALQEMVKEQKAKIEQLERNFRAAKVDAKLKTSEIERLNNELVSADEVIGFREAEIERLQEVTTNTVNSSIRFGLDKEQEIRKAKSEAYKEFAERLHQNCEKYPYTLPSVLANIEITYEELTKGGNEE